MHTPIAIRSLFADVPTGQAHECFEAWLEAPSFRLERIVSSGQRTPDGEWYDQPHDEWVALLQGAARLRIDNQPDLLELGPGDSVHLPAHCRHRVEWTDPEQATIWLALHFTPP